MGTTLLLMCRSGHRFNKRRPFRTLLSSYLRITRTISCTIFALSFCKLLALNVIILTCKGSFPISFSPHSIPKFLYLNPPKHKIKEAITHKFIQLQQRQSAKMIVKRKIAGVVIVNS